MWNFCKTAWWRSDPRTAERIECLFDSAQRQHHQETDRIFVALMLVQWFGGILLALIVSPRTWIGTTSYPHVHVWAATFLGGAISSAPIFLALRYPGRMLTRHVIALAQALWSALLIHLTGGRIETHFHVFGSLAFLAFYRDWRVLVTASLVVAMDHIVRGLAWPQSVYGVFVESPYRWIEHAAWVGFEDVFLVISCLRGQRASWENCERQANLELTKESVEDEVTQRTRELHEANALLAKELQKHKQTQAERERLYSALVAASRQAGMAEVATGVLHNVGNILNSVNVSTQLLVDKLTANRTGGLVQACQLIDEHREALDVFFTRDPRGQKLPDYLRRLAAALSREQHDNLDELRCLAGHVEHMKQIVSMQQSYARVCDMQEPVHLHELMEDALKFRQDSLTRHGITVERQFEELPEIMTDKHKVVQILVNLVGNAIHALHGKTDGVPTIRLRLGRSASDRVALQVCDNGIGIAEQDLPKIFTHGFTTKKDGHGFGLHSGVLAAKELKGALSVQSDGASCGATFTLELPLTLPHATQPVVAIPAGLHLEPAGLLSHANPLV